MSEIASIGSGGIGPAPPQGVAGAVAGQGTQVAQTASARNMASSVSVQETHQLVGVSVSSQVETMAAQFGMGVTSDELTRNLVVLLLLLTLLELLEGQKERGQLTAGSLGQGQGGAFLLSSSSYSASMFTTSSSTQLTAGEAYASSSMAAGLSTGYAGPEAVAPADTQGAMNAGDGGHQLNVIA